MTKNRRGATTIFTGLLLVLSMSTFSAPSAFAAVYDSKSTATATSESFVLNTKILTSASSTNFNKPDCTRRASHTRYNPYNPLNYTVHITSNGYTYYSTQTIAGIQLQTVINYCVSPLPI